MANKRQIEAKEYVLNEIFDQRFKFFIPNYQRPYAWTKQEIGELFDDLYEFHSDRSSDQMPYFLGSIVLVEKKDDDNPHAYEVIDGQQRLTTLTILFAVIANELKGNQEFHKEVLRRIKESGDRASGIPKGPRLCIRKKDNQFFQDAILSLDFKKLESASQFEESNKAQEKIKNAAVFFQSKISEKFENDCNRVFEFFRTLINSCFLVCVTTEELDAATRIFSVMNSRGLDLDVCDILKAKIIEKIDHGERDDYTSKWEDMEGSLGRKEFNNIFLHWRMIKAQKKSRKGILKEFEENVWSAENSELDPSVLIDIHLAKYVDAVSQIRHSKLEYCAEESAVQLEFLNKIDDADWMPLAMEFVKKLNEDHNLQNNPEVCKKFFFKLERLAAFFYITSVARHKRIERYCASFNDIRVGNNEFGSLDLTPEEKTNFKNELGGDIYLLPPKKRTYFVLRLDSFFAGVGAKYTMTYSTIEHVLPQNPEKGSEWTNVNIWPEKDRADWLHKIANLVPLNKRRNAKARNYPFKKKKEKYFDGTEDAPSYVMTNKLRDEKEWTPKVLQERQAELMEIFAKNWDLN